MYMDIGFPQKKIIWIISEFQDIYFGPCICHMLCSKLYETRSVFLTSCVRHNTPQPKKKFHLLKLIGEAISSLLFFKSSIRINVFLKKNKPKPHMTSKLSVYSKTTSYDENHRFASSSKINWGHIYCSNSILCKIDLNCLPFL